jgi:hypothetical protein
VSGAGIPVIADVTFRVSQDGAMIGIDFECKDGQTRTVALPAADLSKMLAGFIWAGDECAARRPPPPLSLPVHEALRDGARTATHLRIADSGGEQFLEVSVGAAHLVIRLRNEQ